MNSISGPRLSPVNHAACSVRSINAGVAHTSTDSPHPATPEHSRSPDARTTKQDEHHSNKLGLFKRLVSSLAASRRKRHDHKVVARKQVTLAIELLQKNRTERKQAHSHLDLFVQHCRKRGLDIAHEMNRASPSSKHSLTEMLDCGDYEGLAILAPFLNSSECGSTLVHRTSDGVYIGQGVKRQGRKGTFFSAEGHGFFLTRAGTSMGGYWQDNEPRGRMITRSLANDLIDFHDVPIMDGHLNGMGVTRYKDGSMLSCEWINGYCQGPGVMTMADGAAIRAVWHQGKMQPGTQYETKDGRIYQGDFSIVNNRPRGHATILWSNGQKNGGFYDGCIEDGEPHGMGRYTFASNENLFGFVYEGPWLNGRKHGSGILEKMVDGKKFNCAFINDVLYKQHL